jgi:ribonuclease D
LVIPFENLITPEYVRRICWNAPKAGVAAALSELGARQWQIEIVAPILEAALLEKTPLVEESENSDTSDTVDSAEASEK